MSTTNMLRVANDASAYTVTCKAPVLPRLNLALALVALALAVFAVVR